MARTLFGGGRLFDGEALGSADVLIEDDRIIGVGSGLDADSIVDCSDKTVLPGLFDCHVHLALSHINLWKHLQTPFSYRFYEAAHNMAATVRSGITTVRDAGGTDLGMKEAAQNGLVLGPRMQIAIGMLSQTGGHGDSWLAVVAAGAGLHAVADGLARGQGLADPHHALQDAGGRGDQCRYLGHGTRPGD